MLVGIITRSTVLRSAVCSLWKDKQHFNIFPPNMVSPDSDTELMLLELFIHIKPLSYKVELNKSRNDQQSVIDEWFRIRCHSVGVFRWFTFSSTGCLKIVDWNKAYWEASDKDSWIRFSFYIQRSDSGRGRSLHWYSDIQTSPRALTYSKGWTGRERRSSSISGRVSSNWITDPPA